MNHDLGGWLWMVITVGCVAVLGIALVYGVNRYRQRTTLEKQQQEEATRRLYREER